MIRDEINGHPEPPRPQRKTPWVLIGGVILAGLVVAHVAGLTKPLKTMAIQFGQGGSSNLQTPASHPNEDWDSDDDKLLQRVYDLVAQDPNRGNGPVDPLAIKALQSSQSRQSGPRNLRTPASRLVGDWESDDDPMFRRVCHLEPKEDWDGTGIYMADAGSGMREVIYRTVSEDRSGTRLELAECIVRTSANYRVHYSVAKDGQSMTREYEGNNGIHVSCQYRYLGPPTEELPQRCPFQ